MSVKRIYTLIFNEQDRNLNKHGFLGGYKGYADIMHLLVEAKPKI